MLLVKNVSKVFGVFNQQILQNISFDVKDGEFVSLTGRSGSGKSTLLYIISTLDLPTSGEVIIDNYNTTTCSSDDLHAFRNRQIGFVFQFHYLLPELSAIENVLMPTRKLPHAEQIQKVEQAKFLLSTFNLKNKYNNFPGQLSGGEQQRVSIARALIMNPKYIFADEPTGNLDSVNGEIVMNIFRKINQEEKTTIIYVTHDEDFAKLAQRQIKLADGQLIEETA
jgi:putative ABC transport system ATP-binding protein/lipoprotein-releasing system ATP-binding protein